MFEVQVEVIEWLGADMYVYFDVSLQALRICSLPEQLGIEQGHGQRTSLVARIDPIDGLKEGDRVRLVLDLEGVLWFDLNEGQNLALPGQASGLAGG